jgi:hypothetical protein
MALTHETRVQLPVSEFVFLPRNRILGLFSSRGMFNGYSRHVFLRCSHKRHAKGLFFSLNRCWRGSKRRGRSAKQERNRLVIVGGEVSLKN